MLDEHGDNLKEAQVASEPDALVDYLRSLPWPIEAIGLEAGPLSQWLHHGLAEDGPVVVVFEQQRAGAADNGVVAREDVRAFPRAGEARPGGRRCGA